MGDSFSLSIDAARPTQLYIDANKLASVLEWFDPAHPDYEPLPVFEHEDEWHLADGHTRAFAGHLSGETRLAVRREPSLFEEYDEALYRECVEWCRAEDVLTIRDLVGRVVSAETFDAAWIDRCNEAAERLGE